MALFGSSRDFSFVRKINNELLEDVIQQEVDYYKLYIPNTKANDTSNLYGEASAQKTYYQPVRLACLIDRSQGFNPVADDQFGIDVTAIYTFNFLRPKLEELSLVPEIGDIIEDRGRYFEVDNANELQFYLGKDKDYGKNVGTEFGRNISIQITAHLARVARLQITKARL
jgi:hypothetical protein